MNAMLICELTVVIAMCMQRHMSIGNIMTDLCR